MNTTTKTYYEARYNNNSFQSIKANSLEELKQAIDVEFTYKPDMAPENVIYWENQKRNLTIHKVTVVSEQI